MLDSKKVEECGCELGRAAGPGERKWASAAFGFPVKGRVTRDRHKTRANAALHPSEIYHYIIFQALNLHS